MGTIMLKAGRGMRSRNSGRAGRIVAILAAVLLLFPGACAEEPQGRAVISERISRNYTAVSSASTMAPYVGGDILLAAETAVTDAGEAEWTENTAGYTGSARVLRVEYGNTVRLDTEIPRDGLYALRIDYYSYNDEMPENRQNVLADRIALSVDGEYPFYECRNVKLQATWMRPEEASYDRYGDEMVSLPVKSARWETAYLTDGTGRRTEPLLLELSAGAHTLEITAKEGSFLLGNLTLCAAPDIPEVEEPRQAEGDALITLQGEKYLCSNASSVHAVMEYDAALDPYEVEHTRLNTIDSDSFRNAGDSLTWQLTAPAAGWYRIALNYRQSDKTGFPVMQNNAPRMPNEQTK